jgi:hypothetical protein
MFDYSVKLCMQPPSPSSQVQLDAKRQRPYEALLRPGIPPQILLEIFPGKSSPPLREDDKDGHYSFILGENLSSRCE